MVLIYDKGWVFYVIQNYPPNHSKSQPLSDINTIDDSE